VRILITGGCGFLGSHLVEHFLKTTEHELVVLDALTYASNGYDRLRAVADGLPVDPRPRVKMVGCNLQLPLENGVLQEIGPIDFVIHAAAESHVDNSIVDPMPFLMSNVIGTHNLLWGLRKLAEQHPVLKHIFVVSTDEVYGPAKPLGAGASEFTEDARFRPANPYAASKAGAEAVAMSHANTYRLPITIVNTMNLIGERQHPEKFVPLVIRKALAGEQIQIHADPTCTRAGSRFYLHCRTYANALSFLMGPAYELSVKRGMTPMPLAEHCPGAALPLKIHVRGELELDNLELARKIADVMGVPLDCKLVDFHSSRPGHDLRYAMDDALIRDMGWQRPMGIMESLERTVKWYLANPQWLHLPAQKKASN
jgi:dTDP-glucose 4,6-dehydratase